MKYKKFFFWVLAFFVIFVFLGMINKESQPDKVENQQGLYDGSQAANLKLNYSSRSYYLGFTPMPSDYSFEAIDDAYEFINGHGDIVSHHFDGGVPWIEALDNSEFSKHLKEQWDIRKSRTPAGHKIFVSINPLDYLRNGLALYWGPDENQPVPEPWNNHKLNDENVKKAYLNYAKRVVEFFKPDYLAIGIETNILISRSPQKWEEYKELHQYVYTELKKIYPDILIFMTLQYEHLRGLEQDSKANSHLQIPEVNKLAEYNDIIALSTYRYGKEHNPIAEDYFNPALSFGKPVAISESGAVSENMRVFGGSFTSSEELQNEYASFVLGKANENKFLFVINFVGKDYDKLISHMPKESQELAKVWVHTGLQRSDGKFKKAAYTWDSHLNLAKN